MELRDLHLLNINILQPNITWDIILVNELKAPLKNLLSEDPALNPWHVYDYGWPHLKSWADYEPSKPLAVGIKVHCMLRNEIHG